MKIGFITFFQELKRIILMHFKLEAQIIKKLLTSKWCIHFKLKILINVQLFLSVKYVLKFHGKYCVMLYFYIILVLTVYIHFRAIVITVFHIFFYYLVPYCLIELIFCTISFFFRLHCLTKYHL